MTLKPSYLFFTSVGRIGVVVDLVAGGSLSRLFTDLERNMSSVFRGVGVPKGPHEEYVYFSPGFPASPDIFQPPEVPCTKELDTGQRLRICTGLRGRRFPGAVPSGR